MSCPIRTKVVFYKLTKHNFLDVQRFKEKSCTINLQNKILVRIKYNVEQSRILSIHFLNKVFYVLT